MLFDAVLRILHVTPYYEPAFIYGGPARSVPLLCRSLAQAGAYVTVFTTDANGSLALDVPLGVGQDRHGVEVFYWPRKRPYSTFRSPAMGRALRSRIGDFDLVHISGLWTWPARVAALESTKRGVPYVISPRGMLMPWEMSHKAQKKQAMLRLSELQRLRRSSGIHCTTASERDALTAFKLGHLGFVVPNAVDITEFASLPPRGELREQLRIPELDPLLLFLGRLHAKKGLDLTLSIFENVRVRQPRAHLVLAGSDEGGYTQRIRAWARDRGQEGHVHVLASLDGGQRLSAFADTDAFVLFSDSENFAMGVAEAMACSLPVVVSEEVGISPWIREYEAGIVVYRQGNQAVDSLIGLLSDVKKRRLLGENGRRLVSEQFAPAVVGQNMLAAYAGML